MPLDFNKSGSRIEQRAKRRKTNIILNTLIAIVIILIIVVGSTIFFGGEDPNKDQTEEAVAVQGAQKEKKDQSAGNSAGEQKQRPVGKLEPPKESAEVDERSDDEEEIAEDEDEKEWIETESDEQNVEKIIVNPDWKPVGTDQVEGHISSYSKGTVDWEEKLQAVSYAVNIPKDNMTLWWIEGGADRQKQAVATVSAKGASNDTYRVHIEWVDGEGWKPTEVKKLMENDKKR